MVKKLTTLKKLHLGCGLNTPDGWINLDGSWNARLAKYPLIRNLMRTLKIFPEPLLNIPWNPNIVVHDVRNPLPFPDASLTCIYASHLLEHLYLEESKRLLTECFRILEPGGILRMVVPDLQEYILEYVEKRPLNSLEDRESRWITSADRFNQRLSLRESSPPTGNILYKLYITNNDFQSHKWMYDAESLSHYFRWSGFIDIKRMDLHESRIINIKQIEHQERVLNSICIEGVKLK